MEVECPLGCGGCLLKSQLSSHVSSQCPNRPVECQYCKTSVPQSHLEVRWYGNNYYTCTASQGVYLLQLFIIKFNDQDY